MQLICNLLTKSVFICRSFDKTCDSFAIFIRDLRFLRHFYTKCTVLSRTFNKICGHFAIFWRNFLTRFLLLTKFAIFLFHWKCGIFYVRILRLMTFFLIFGKFRTKLVLIHSTYLRSILWRSPNISFFVVKFFISENYGNRC